MTTRAPRFDYQRYLASREWAVLKRAVHARSFGYCERHCGRKASQVHHLTYERLGHELLTDLLDVCTLCHEYLSAVIDVDPATTCTPEEALDWEELLQDDDDPELVARVHAWVREVEDAWAR